MVHSYTQIPVDKPTRRCQSLTQTAVRSLYLKYLVLNKVLNKDKKRIKNIVVKNGIALLIVILTNNQVVSANAANPSIELYKLFAHMQVGNDKQYRCLVTLWTLESNWNSKAKNPKSSAMGIPQLLKMTETNPYKQIDLGIKYITHHRIYKGDTCKALDRHKKVGHY